MEDVTKMIHDGQPATEASEHLANFVIQEAVSATVAAAADSLSLSETLVVVINCDANGAASFSTLLRMETSRLTSLGLCPALIRSLTTLKLLYRRGCAPLLADQPPGSCVEDFLETVEVDGSQLVIAVDLCRSASGLFTPVFNRKTLATLITCKPITSYDLSPGWTTVFTCPDLSAATNCSHASHLSLFPLLQLSPFDSHALSSILSVCDVGPISSRVPDPARSLHGKLRSSVGCWTVAARAELSLALLRLSSYDTACVTRVARLLAGSVDGRWSTAVLATDLRWDTLVAFILAVNVNTGAWISVCGPDLEAVHSDARQHSWPLSVAVGGSCVVSFGGHPFRSIALASRKRDVALTSTGVTVSDDSLSCGVRTSLKCIGMIAMGNLLSHLALYSFSLAFASRASKTSAWEWLLLARCAEQCHHLPVAIDAYRRAALLLTDSDRIHNRIQLLTEVISTAPSKAACDAVSSKGAVETEPQSKPSKSSLLTLECQVPLSESVIWQLQSWFYDSVGASAWGECGPVPFDITSNAFIANQYAQIALTMLPETSLARTPTRADRLIVVEMGTGHGKFGFLFLQRLKALYESWLGSRVSSEWPSVTYVMTDFTPSNVQLLRNHPCLKPLVAAGVLDFAVFDALRSATLNLLVGGVSLVPATRVMIVSNYFIDTLPAEAYRVIDGHLHKGLITTHLKWKAKDVATGQKVVTSGSLSPGSSISMEELTQLQTALPKTSLLHKCSVTYSWVATEEEICEDIPVDRPFSLDSAAIQASVIGQQASAFRSAGVNRSFLHHSTALNCLERLRQLCCSGEDGSAFVVVVTDKGESCISNIIADADAPDPYIAKHGSISVSVNFTSLALAFSSCHANGFCISPDPPPRNSSICTSVFGIAPEQLRLFVGLATSACMTRISPDGFYTLMDRLDGVTKRLRIDTLPGDGSRDSIFPIDACMSLLKLSLHDPGTFVSLAPHLQRICAHTPVSERQASQIVDAVTSMVLLCYTVNPSDKYDALVEAARLLVILGPQYCGLALELVNSSMRVREELGKLFPRFLLGTAGATVRYAAKGSASPQARALFLKAHALKAIGRQPEAAAMMEHCAAIHSKYRPVAVSWSGVRSGRTSNVGFPVATPLTETSETIRQLQSRRLYFRKRLDECTRQALASEAGSSEGKHFAQEMELIVRELARLNDTLDKQQ